MDAAASCLVFLPCLVGPLCFHEVTGDLKTGHFTLFSKFEGVWGHTSAWSQPHRCLLSILTTFNNHDLVKMTETVKYTWDTAPSIIFLIPEDLLFIESLQGWKISSSSPQTGPCGDLGWKSPLVGRWRCFCDGQNRTREGKNRLWAS